MDIGFPSLGFPHLIFADELGWLLTPTTHDKIKCFFRSINQDMPLFTDKQKAAFTPLFGGYEGEQLEYHELNVERNEIETLEKFIDNKGTIPLDMTNEKFSLIFEVSTYFCPRKYLAEPFADDSIQHTVLQNIAGTKVFKHGVQNKTNTFSFFRDALSEHAILKGTAQPAKNMASFIYPTPSSPVTI